MTNLNRDLVVVNKPQQRVASPTFAKYKIAKKKARLLLHQSHTVLPFDFFPNDAHSYSESAHLLNQVVLHVNIPVWNDFTNFSSLSTSKVNQSSNTQNVIKFACLSRKEQLSI